MFRVTLSPPCHTYTLLLSLHCVCVCVCVCAQLLRLAGGWVHLQQGRLSGAVLMEVQNIVRGYLEREWLPLFLATPQFSQRQTLKVA